MLDFSLKLFLKCDDEYRNNIFTKETAKGF